MQTPKDISDVIIVGGGPAGLSAGLLLGRSRRKVLLFDDRLPRNRASPELHGFLGHEGISPLELLERGRSELSRYPSVIQVNGRITGARSGDGIFRVLMESGVEHRARALLVACGLTDRLPNIGNLEQFYGHNVHVCPYCSGWECAGSLIGVTGDATGAAQLALELLLWSERITLFADVKILSNDIRNRLAKHGVTCHADPPMILRGVGCQLQRVVLGSGQEIACDALFVVPTQEQHAGFLKDLGSEWNHGWPACEDNGRTNIPGLYLAGNTTPGLQLAMIAAAEGVKAAAAINDWLLISDGILPEA